jgi:hypothetical protein
MPEERDIEKSLRAWAKRRREDAGAPLDLHPATRKLLQDEVSRLKKSPRREPGRFARLLWGSPLRLALNLSVVAVLIFAAAVFLPLLRQHPDNISIIAENKRLPDRNAQPAVAESDNPGGGPPTPAVEVAPAIAAPQPVPEVAMRKAKSVTNTVALADNVTMYKTPVTSAASAAPSVAPPVPTAAPLSLDQEKSATRQFATSDLAVAPANEPGSVAAASANQVAPAAAAVQKLAWINSPVVADRRDGDVAKLGAPAMLGSFRTEQTGDQLRVIDADGSVYAGNLTASTEILDSNGAFPAAQTRAFRVTGTNLTLHQPVVFTGNLIFADQSSLHGKKDVSGAVVVSGGIVAGAGGGGGGFGGFGGAATNRVVTRSGSIPVPGAAAGTAAVAGATPISGLAAQTVFSAGALPPQPQFRVEGTALIGTNVIQINAVPFAP